MVIPEFLKAIPWKLVGIIAAVLLVSVVWFRGDHYKKEAARFEAAMNNAVDINDANAKIFDSYKADNERLKKLISDLTVKKADIHEKSVSRRKVIENAPPSDDAPLAPVLRDELNQLREPQSPHEDRAGGHPTTTG